MSDQPGIQRCRVTGCNGVLEPIVPKSNPAGQELYCSKCHLSYSKYSPKLAGVLPHIHKEMAGGK